MPKKSIIAILSAVVLMVVASIAMVFTIGPKTSADSEVIETVPVDYLNITSDGALKGLTADGRTWIKNHAKYRIEIPANITVTSIGESAFYNCSGLTSITIPESVTGIGYRAFEDCSGLTSITIPEGVTVISNYAFSGCSGLTSITIPEGVTNFGSGAFQNCSGLMSMTVDPNNTKYTSQDNEGHECNCIIIKSSNILLFGCQNTIIPEGVTRIGDYAFRGCSGLMSITIPEGVTNIGTYAFSYCSGLTSITIPEGVTSIRDHTFAYCTNLTSITIPDSVTSIGEYAFYGCSGLTGSITIPEGVTSIGTYTFYNCSGITSIAIPESVTGIGYHAFENCSGLTSITLPASLTSIGSQAFRGSGLKSINYLGTIDQWVQVNITDEYAHPAYYTNKLVINGIEITTVELSNTVTRIGDYAFYNCSGLTSITIPESVTSIGKAAFYMCSGLTGSITIPEGVTSIGEHAFNRCSGLTSITIPASVTSIGNYAFCLCSGLTSVTFAESSQLTRIDTAAFLNCSGLTSITIPEGVTSIGNSAFYNCSGLNEIIVLNPDLIGNTNLTYGNSAKVYLGADQNTVSFVTNCDTTIDSRLIDFGGVTPEPTITLTKEHYTFAGWYSDEQYTKPFTFETPIKHDITLYAKWDADKFTVTFNSNGGSDVNSRQVDYGTTTTSPRPSKTGYKLIGWYLNDEPYNFSTPVTSDITLVAQWERLCVVTFDSNGGYEINPLYVEKNGYAYFRWTEKPYHGLVGWKLNGETFDFANTPITEDITLVADWEIYTYEVTFNSNGGTLISKQTVEHGAKVINPTDPTRDGYFFCGWYLVGTNSATEYDFETPVTEYMTLTAVWKKIYNVTFANANGEVYTTRAVVEGDLVQAPDITVDGYLVSWYAGDKAYDFTTPVTGDMTLTAQLDESSVKVNNQNNSALIWGITGTAAGILVIGGLVAGVVISKRRRK